ncbi:hypothetical protein M569_11852, partial [Genlisea aurea]
DDKNKRKRRPVGTPDPDAEVVSLSPRTLLESDRYFCEICSRGFQREQNLQMHRRRHKVPWKLLKRESPLSRKRAFVCPERTCLHHDPRHALGDLVGIKKHFRRKHGDRRQWVCERCSKGYAVQSDYKAHVKTCGTRGHSCDCGRVFSRVESFIEHQDSCDMRRFRSDPPSVTGAPLHRSPTPSSDADLSVAVASWVLPGTVESFVPAGFDGGFRRGVPPSLELRLLTGSENSFEEDRSTTQLQLSIGSSGAAAAEKLREEAGEAVRMAAAEKVYADDTREKAKREVQAAAEEFSKAKKLRRQAQAELENARALRERAAVEIGTAAAMMTCHYCRMNLRP